MKSENQRRIQSENNNRSGSFPSSRQASGDSRGAGSQRDPTHSVTQPVARQQRGDPNTSLRRDLGRLEELQQRGDPKNSRARDSERSNAKQLGVPNIALASESTRSGSMQKRGDTNSSITSRHSSETRAQNRDGPIPSQSYDSSRTGEGSAPRQSRDPSGSTPRGKERQDSNDSSRRQFNNNDAEPTNQLRLIKGVDAARTNGATGGEEDDQWAETEEEREKLQSVLSNLFYVMFYLI